MLRDSVTNKSDDMDLRQGTLGDPGPAGALPGSSDFPLQAGFGKWPLNVEGMRVKRAPPV